MPLSEQEQRLLEEMERSLYQNDADFVATVSGRRGKPDYRFLVGGILLAVAGVATLVVGVIVQFALVGILGFAVMFAGVLLAIAPPRRGGSAAAPEMPRAASGSRPARSSGFMDRVNQRWERRQENGD